MCEMLVTEYKMLIESQLNIYEKQFLIYLVPGHLLSCHQRLYLNVPSIPF